MKRLVEHVDTLILGHFACEGSGSLEIRIGECGWYTILALAMVAKAGMAHFVT